MKKIVLILLCFILLICCMACGAKVENQKPDNFEASVPTDNQESSTPIIPNAHTFTGEVLSIEKGMILVAPKELNSAISPEVYVNTSQFSELKFKKGDTVTITFNGQVAQSFPPQILGVIDIVIE